MSNGDVIHRLRSNALLQRMVRVPPLGNTVVPALVKGVRERAKCERKKELAKLLDYLELA